MDESTFRVIVYTSILLLTPLSLLSTYRLFQISRSNKVKALRERAIASLLSSVSAVFMSIYVLGRLFGSVEVPSYESIFLVGLSAIFAQLPSFFWYIRYQTDGFDDDSSTE